jgi:DNA polymerase beta
MEKWFLKNIHNFLETLKYEAKVNLSTIDNLLEMDKNKVIDKQYISAGIDRSKKNLITQFEILIHKVNSETSTDSTAPFKVKGYSETIKALETYPEFEITQIDSVKDWLVFQGKKNPSKILSKIEEFIEKGYIEEAKVAMNNGHVRAVLELTKIYGVGPAKVKELYTLHHITTIKELKDKIEQMELETQAKTCDKVATTNGTKGKKGKAKVKVEKLLNDKQLLGLKYFNELEEKIPRSEMCEYDELLKNVCNKIDPTGVLQYSINGSYRRGNLVSGDIDVLITATDGKQSYYRQNLKESLIKMGVIEAVLADGDKKFMGITRLSKSHTARHIDIMDTDLYSYPFAVLYFTGSGSFNVLMRNHALKLGFSLNEYCLSDKNSKKTIDSEIIMDKIGKSKFEEERDIFNFLGLVYVEPEKRNDLANFKSVM